MESETQEHIKKQAMEERKNGTNVKIGYTKLIVNGQEWTWDDEEGRLMEVKKFDLNDDDERGEANTLGGNNALRS
ncbi:hypothetical protein ILUMI_16845 [Ignelater luminosus]|uniref:Uncharacterized protein n=1 Tax=Ignelater luminosus TaxID=2038154 RepID=A0A8K0CKZ9_IGNLU|nr:hypothetical protein ILUMI_16845 [Ignelater luminosus]